MEKLDLRSAIFQRIFNSPIYGPVYGPVYTDPYLTEKLDLRSAIFQRIFNWFTRKEKSKDFVNLRCVLSGITEMGGHSQPLIYGTVYGTVSDPTPTDFVR